jgi:hypothetical protein
MKRFFLGALLVVPFVGAPPAAAAAGAALPSTGMPLWPILVAGATLIGGGLLLFISDVRRSKRERERSETHRPARTSS